MDAWRGPLRLVATAAALVNRIARLALEVWNSFFFIGLSDRESNPSLVARFETTWGKMLYQQYLMSLSLQVMLFLVIADTGGP